MDQDQEQAIGRMLEQVMAAVEASLRAVTAQLRAFDFAAHAVSETYFRQLVESHASALQEAKVVTRTLEHWTTLLEQGHIPNDPAP
jgi:hypothetical protein